MSTNFPNLQTPSPNPQNLNNSIKTIIKSLSEPTIDTVANTILCPIPIENTQSQCKSFLEKFSSYPLVSTNNSSKVSSLESPSIGSYEIDEEINIESYIKKIDPSFSLLSKYFPAFDEV